MAKSCVLVLWRLFVLLLSLTATLHTTSNDHVDTTTVLFDNGQTTPEEDMLTTANANDYTRLTTTLDSVDDKLTTTSRSADSTCLPQNAHLSFSMLDNIIGAATVTSGTNGLGIRCQLNLQWIEREAIDVTRISMYRTIYNSYVVMENFVSVVKLANTSAISWSNETLHSRPGVHVDWSIHGNEPFLKLTIDPSHILCDDAVEYMCVMSATTATGPLLSISNSDRVSVYPKVAPYYTEEIQSNIPPMSINHLHHYEYSIGTILLLSCTGSVGSDVQNHLWQVGSTNDPCKEAAILYRVGSENIERDGCNYKRTSSIRVTVPDVKSPIVVWCWPSNTKSATEECAQLATSSVVKSFTIVPVAVKPPPPSVEPSVRGYILQPNRTTYRQDETLELTCRYIGRTTHLWYFRRMPSDTWSADKRVVEMQDADDWYNLTLSTKVSLMNRGWYTCHHKSVHVSNENQTVFVDVLYETCRENGIRISGDTCLEVTSAAACSANNGTIASIHTPQKSKLIYGFAFHVLHIPRYVSIGLTITASAWSWRNFIWADGSPFTYSENIPANNCLVCQDLPIALAMEFDTSDRIQINWVAVQDANVLCEWQSTPQLTAGLAIPQSTSTYSGSKAMFRCTSGEVISTVYVCDRTPDCIDASDELNCADGCSGTTFQCDYGECISASSVCDFVKDCADGSDELICDHPPCGNEFWQCNNKECVPVYDVCDGEVECSDGSDEADDLCITNSILPSAYTFLCFEPNRIFPAARLCDGIIDCSDKFGTTDESGCSPASYSCLVWRMGTKGVNSSQVNVNYGMFQYGETEVQCIANTDVDTVWPFSSVQDTIKTYEAEFDSNAVWFKSRAVMSTFQRILYMSESQQRAMLASSTSCVQYIRLCSFFIGVFDVTVDWINSAGDSFSLVVPSTMGCLGFCTNVRCAVYWDYDTPPDSQYYDGNEDYGWIPITNKHQLPITSVTSSYTTIIGVSPLICSEDIQETNTRSPHRQKQCRNRWNFNARLECLMNFDPTGEPTGCRDLSHLVKCENFICPDEYVKCPDSFCLHMRYICDGTKHCPHGEDELDCESTNCTNHYRCRGGKPCVPFTYICDGIRQCPQGDDELLCQNTCPAGCTCHGLTFLCDIGELDIRLNSITSDARWINMRTNLTTVADHIPLAFPLLATLILQSCYLQQLNVHDQSMFRNMTGLRHLDISSNQVKSIPDDIFKDLVGLRTLILSNNPIALISKKAFNGLKDLKSLQVSQSNIKELSVESWIFNGLESLEHLDLSSNLVRNLPRNIFIKMKALKTLVLNSNPLIYIDIQAFSHLYSLTSLQLANLNNTRLNSGVFFGLRSLTALNLSSSGISDLGSKSFIDLDKLETLDIQNNHLVAEEFMFDGLANLQYLYADSYKMCCIKPQSVLDENCFAPKDLISSCSNLIGSDFLRVFLWIIGLSALVGNLFVIIYRVIIDKDNLKKSHSIFVINLSISDFVMGMYMIIIASVDTHYSGRYAIHDLTWRQGPLCVTAGCLSVISSEMSTFAILMITVDRFLAIVFPLSLRKITWRTAVVLSAMLWIISLMLAIVPTAVFPSYFKGEFYSRSGVCLALPLTGEYVPGQEYSVAIFIGLNGVLFFTILIAQICIHRKCKGSGIITTTQNRKREIAVARSLFLVVATDFVCWFPVGVIGTWSQLGGSVSADVYAWMMVFVLPVNSAINPFLYTYTYLKRKHEINGVLKQGKRNMETTKGTLSTSDVFNTSNVLKAVYFSKLIRTKKGSVSLEKYGLTSKLSPTQAYQIARRTMKALSFLHDRLAIHGNVSEKCVYVNNKTQALKYATLELDEYPISGDHDSYKDILQYGFLIKKLLRMLDRL